MTALVEIKIPDIGDFDAVEVIELHSSAGDEIGIEDPIISLESDKATMEVPSPVAGVLKELKVNIGDKVAEGTLIALVEASDDSQNDVRNNVQEPEQAATSVEEKTPRHPVTKNSATKNSATKVSAEEPAAKPTAAHIPPASLPPPAEKAGVGLSHASPAIRRFARELGADLSQIKGHGPKGRITNEDVQSYIKGRLGSESAVTPSGGDMGIPAMPKIDFAKFGQIEIQKLSRIKRISGPHLHRAWLNVPHVTHHDEADVSDLEAFRKSLKAEAEKRGLRVTALAFIMKALVNALKAFPSFNASLSHDGESLILKKYYHIGIAVDTPNGLVVPVFKDVDQKGIYELTEEMGDMSSRARDGKLKLAEMQGGCMSISSLGGIGGTAFTPIVNAPEIAILGVTRAKMQPVWNGTEFEPRLLLPLDLSYDHRVIDGAAAARFVAHLCSLLGDMKRVLL